MKRILSRWETRLSILFIIFGVFSILDLFFLPYSKLFSFLAIVLWSATIIVSITLIIVQEIGSKGNSQTKTVDETAKDSAKASHLDHSEHTNHESNKPEQMNSLEISRCVFKIKIEPNEKANEICDSNFAVSVCQFRLFPFPNFAHAISKAFLFSNTSSTEFTHGEKLL